MKEIVRGISAKGQVTLPVEVRRALGVGPKDKVAFRIDEGEIKVHAAQSAVDATYQAVPALKRRLTWKQVRAIALEDAAEDAVGESV